MKEWLEFDNPKVMDEVIRKACICYQQNKTKGDMSKRWADKKGNKLIPSHKGNKSTNNKGLDKGQCNWDVNKPKFKVLGETRKNEQTRRSEAELINRPPAQ